MPGKFCNGKHSQQPLVKESRAFSDGMYYRTTGTAAAKPITDNPFPAWNAQDHNAWNNGWNTADAKAGGVLTREDAECTAWAGLSVPPAV